MLLVLFGLTIVLGGAGHQPPPLMQFCLTHVPQTEDVFLASLVLTISMLSSVSSLPLIMPTSSRFMSLLCMTLFVGLRSFFHVPFLVSFAWDTSCVRGYTVPLSCSTPSNPMGTIVGCMKEIGTLKRPLCIVVISLITPPMSIGPNIELVSLGVMSTLSILGMGSRESRSVLFFCKNCMMAIKSAEILFLPKEALSSVNTKVWLVFVETLVASWLFSGTLSSPVSLVGVKCLSVGSFLVLVSIEPLLPVALRRNLAFSQSP